MSDQAAVLELVARVRRGEQEAAAELYRRFEKVIRRKQLGRALDRVMQQLGLE